MGALVDTLMRGHAGVAVRAEEDGLRQLADMGLVSGHTRPLFRYGPR